MAWKKERVLSMSDECKTVLVILLIAFFICAFLNAMVLAVMDSDISPQEWTRNKFLRFVFIFLGPLTLLIIAVVMPIWVVFKREE